MKQNINKVAERGENLDHLGQQTEVLQQKSQDFTKRARAVRLEMRWKNNKMKIWIGLAVLFIILVVVIPLGRFSAMNSYFNMANQVFCSRALQVTKSS